MPHLRSLFGVFVVLGVLVAVQSAAAQMSAGDAKAVEGHRLSVDLVKRATAANLALKEGREGSPGVWGKRWTTTLAASRSSTRW